MNDDKLLGLLKQSGDDVKIPEALEPEQIKKQLPPEKKILKWYQRPPMTAAAVACIALFAVIVTYRTGLFSNGNTSGPNDNEIPQYVRQADEEADNDIGLAEAADLDDTDMEITAGEAAAENRNNTAAKNATEAAPAPSDISEESLALNGVTAAGSYEEVYNALQVVENRYKNDSGFSLFSSDSSIEVKEEAADGAAADMGAADEASDMDDSASKNDMSAGMAEDEAESAIAEAGDDFSQTNLREAGVDEADIIKTDGNFIYKLSSSYKLTIIETKEGQMKETTTIQLGNRDEDIQEFYLDGDTLSVITNSWESTLYETENGNFGSTYKEYVRCHTYDISDRNSPQLTGTVQQEGSYNSSRKNGDYIYLFTYYYPDTYSAAAMEDLVPTVNTGLLRAESIFIPDEDFIQNTTYLVVSSLNINDPGKTADSKGIISGGYMLYVSTRNIYITNYDWNDKSQIIKIAYEDGRITPKATVTLAGQIDDSFSMDEYNGYLRVLTTEYGRSVTTNNLNILNDTLQTVGRIDDIAPDETIRSARFMGDTGYFVTFRQIDPLFSVDLSDPENPEIIGELKITGFSQYLHGYGEDKLLGIGWEVDPNTNTTVGLKLSMFDISDPSKVTETDKYILRNVEYCPALYNYKAFLVDPEKNLIGFAAEEYYATSSAIDGFTPVSADSSSTSMNKTGSITAEMVSADTDDEPTDPRTSVAPIIWEEGTTTEWIVEEISEADMAATTDAYYPYNSWVMKYFLFSYDETNGFTLNYTYDPDNHSEGEYYYNYYEPRGLYIGDVFYLITDTFTQSYRMSDNYKSIDLIK